MYLNVICVYPSEVLLILLTIELRALLCFVCRTRNDERKYGMEYALVISTLSISPKPG